MSAMLFSRLAWLEADFLNYIYHWRDTAPHKMAFLSQETYEALVVTTLATVQCTRHLLSSGFKYVLTAKFSSDEIEALFSSIRQLNGSNDQTDAYSALSALQKILVSGVLHASQSANVEGTSTSLGRPLLMLPSSRTVAQSDTATHSVDESLKLYCQSLSAAPDAPRPGVKTSTLALIAGYLVKAVQDSTECSGCVELLKGPSSRSCTTALIAGIDRGGLCYPKLEFVGFLFHLETAANAMAKPLLNVPHPLRHFVDKVMPHVVQNPLFSCGVNPALEHKRGLVRLILEKFMRPFLSNYANNASERGVKRRAVGSKPLSTKVLKL